MSNSCENQLQPTSRRLADRITLCADDYGYTPYVSEGILELVQNNRLSAVSCLTTFPDWQSEGPKLLEYWSQKKVQVGLHLNLTEGKSLTYPKKLVDAKEEFKGLLPPLLLSHLRLLSKNQILAEFDAQLEAFKEVMDGRLPDFIDGHQHIHHFPIIRSALLELIHKHWPPMSGAMRPLVRISSNSGFPPLLNLKKLVLHFSGARALRKTLERYNIPHNTSFSGVYNLNPRVNYSRLFQQFLTESSHGGLIMCHPGKDNMTDDNSIDPIEAARLNEYEYFSSDKFLVNVEKSGLSLS